MAIDTNFTAPPSPPSSSDPINFRTRADAFVTWIVTFVSNLISFITQLNSTEVSINAKEASAVAAAEAAVASANYQGIFVQGTSTAVKGQSWSYGGASYRCAVDTSNNPTTEPASWVSTSLDAVIHAATAKATPVDADEFGYWDSVSGFLRKVNFANLKATLRAYFDTLYRPIGALLFSDMPAGSVIQVANYTTTAFATGSTFIPNDDSIPQITEGTQFLSLVFTPKKANSKLKIEVVTHTASGGTDRTIIGIFKDGGVNAICAFDTISTANSLYSFNNMFFTDAVSTATATFTVRIGATASSINLNGESGSRRLGGALSTSITITEIAQ